jgi:rhodanese-related sulfurtransferase
MLNGIMKSPWLAGAATGLAVISCYGTGFLIGVLSLLGVSVALNERAWAGAISVFAVLAAALIGVSSWRRRVVHPAVIAAVGLALILWTVYGAYSRVAELFGFGFLIVATVLEWRVRSASQPAASDVSWIDAADLVTRLRQAPAPIVLDVRGAEEFTGELGHIAGARNISLGEIPQRLSEIDRHKTEAIVLVCKTQMRSAKAAAILTGSGFRDVQVLRGGMEQWNRNDLPVEGRSAPRPS